MNVDPASAPAVEPIVAREINDLLVRKRCNLMKFRVEFQKFQPAARIPYEQFSKNEIVPANDVSF